MVLKGKSGYGIYYFGKFGGERSVGLFALIPTKVGFDKTTRFESDTRVGQRVIFIPNDDNSNFLCPEPSDRSLEAM